MRSAYFTICARNYLAYALTLRASVLEHGICDAFYIFLSDADIVGDEPCDNIVSLNALPLSDLHAMSFRYSLMEFSTAIKPTCFEHLFDQHGFDRAVYLDPDIQLFNALTDVDAAFDSGADAVITPHIIRPLPDDGKQPSNKTIAQCGQFNLGFGAFANTPSSRQFLTWWAERCTFDCIVDFPNGLFVDQKFVDEAPKRIDHLHVLNDPGYNVAYWNIGQRQVVKDKTGSLTAGGAPLRFFHFSGVNPARPNEFSKHQNRFGLSDIGDAAALVQSYIDHLRGNGFDQWQRVPYAFANFANGDKIPPAARRLFRQAEIAGIRAFEPFDADYDALNTAAHDTPGDPTISEFMRMVWQMRPDIQHLYPLSETAGRRAFHYWFTNNAIAEGLATPPLVPNPLSMGPLDWVTKFRAWIAAKQ